MTTRADHYGLAEHIGRGSFTSYQEAARWHERFTVAFRDFRKDTGVATLEDFYGAKGSRHGWIWQECTGAESDPEAERRKHQSTY